MIRGDGKLEKKWKNIKNANMFTTVRTSDPLGSVNWTQSELIFQTINALIPNNTMLTCWLRNDSPPFYFLFYIASNCLRDTAILQNWSFMESKCVYF